MIGKTIALRKTDGELEPFPEFPAREDMQNWNYLHKRGQAAALALHVGESETTTAGCEIPVGPTLRRVEGRRSVRVPDLTVSRNSRPDLIEEDGGYAIDRQGKPPDFVLEVASKTTGALDYTSKRSDYERYGVREYWRFDPTGGEYHDSALAGDRLVSGVYVGVDVEWLDESRCWGYSESLGLWLCWEYGELRFYDPVGEGYLLTHDEEMARAESEAFRADRAEEELMLESAARRRAEAELRRLRERMGE